MTADIYSVLSAVLTPLALPLGLAVFLITLALFLGNWKPALSRTLTLVSVLLLWVASAPESGRYLVASLEKEFPAQSIEKYPQVDAIVLLGGGIELATPPRVDAELGFSADRVLHAARLYKAERAKKLLVVEGSAFRSPNILNEAEETVSLLQEWGVPVTDIVVNADSRNTRDNGKYAAKLLADIGAESILLVTSAWHMPRAMEVFSHYTPAIIAAPTDFRSPVVSRPFVSSWLPSVGGLQLTSIALKEYYGIWVYRIIN